MSFYATINNFIAENAIIFSVIIPILSGSLGAYVSYAVTIKSAKRKEFNDVAEPVIDAFEVIIQNDRFSGYCLNGLDINLREIQRRLSQSDKILFCKYIDEYSDITRYIFSKYCEFGQIDNKNIPNDETKKYLDIIKKILKIINLR